MSLSGHCPVPLTNLKHPQDTTLPWLLKLSSSFSSAVWALLDPLLVTINLNSVCHVMSYPDTILIETGLISLIKYITTDILTVIIFSVQGHRIVFLIKIFVYAMLYLYPALYFSTNINNVMFVISNTKCHLLLHRTDFYI